MLAATPTGLSPAPLITGDDLVDMGMKPGPRFKSLLDAIYDAQLEGRIATAEEAESMARMLYED